MPTFGNGRRERMPFPASLLRAAPLILTGALRNALFHRPPLASPSFSGRRGPPDSLCLRKTGFALPLAIGAIGWRLHHLSVQMPVNSMWLTSSRLAPSPEREGASRRIPASRAERTIQDCGDIARFWNRPPASSTAPLTRRYKLWRNSLAGIVIAAFIRGAASS